MTANPPNFTKQAAKSYQKLAEQLVLIFRNVSNWIQFGFEKGEGYELQTEVKKLLKDLHQTKTLMKDAADSLEYNPFGKKSIKELQEMKQRIYYLNQGYTYLSSIVGTFVAWSAAGTITPLQVSEWTEQLMAFIPFLKHKETWLRLNSQVRY
ncbi:hypothetical protein [Neobacillus sp. PS3-40]|uniref:hypothetical protein n=1 Tax=Neobacillus sp. PS3-40 TaxID=3070679 RepID=UPI0027DFE2B7|nr:hypothetical protein [Neobacillus sp. PS3-40]WML44174.1 hypothetical protein RCG20_20745 [Neobacillus sp. PS3-40]